jgi:hypothetical protein
MTSDNVDRRVTMRVAIRQIGSWIRQCECLTSSRGVARSVVQVGSSSSSRSSCDEDYSDDKFSPSPATRSRASQDTAEGVR